MGKQNNDTIRRRLTQCRTKTIKSRKKTKNICKITDLNEKERKKNLEM